MFHHEENEETLKEKDFASTTFEEHREGEELGGEIAATFEEKLFRKYAPTRDDQISDEELEEPEVDYDFETDPAACELCGKPIQRWQGGVQCFACYSER